MADFFLDKSDPKYYEHLNAATTAMTMSDAPMVITVKKWSPKRGNNWNRYYWKTVMGYLSEETGLDKMDLHDRCFKPYVLPWFMTAEQIEEGDFSTTILSNKQFEDYTDFIRSFSEVFLHCPIPCKGCVNE